MMTIDNCIVILIIMNKQFKTLYLIVSLFPKKMIPFSVSTDEIAGLEYDPEPVGVNNIALYKLCAKIMSNNI